jgi:hypothetical protein
MPEFIKYHIQKGRLVKVPNALRSEFGKGDCYLIDTESIIYLWCGPLATPDERFVGAVTSVWRDQARRGAARLVTVEPGEEPAEFLELFDGEIDVTDLDTEGFLKEVVLEKKEYKLWRIHITGGINLFIEVPRERESLTSDDVYLLDTFDKIFIWRGTTSTGREKFHGMLIARRYDFDRAGAQKIILIDEGEETREFLDALEG